MAIVKMKHLRLFGLRSDREELLRQLQHLGCVEVGEPAIDLSDPEWAGLTRPDGQGLSQAKEQSAAVGSALETLKKYVPAKDGMFRKRPELTEAEFFDKADYAAGLDTARHINDAERRINTLRADRSKMEAQRASLAPWSALDVPLEMTGDGTLSVIFGTIPARADFAAMEGAVLSAADMASLTDAGADRELRYFLLVCHASVESACTEAMRPYGFSRANLKDWTGTAEDNIRDLDGKMAALDAEMESVKAEIVACGDRREALLRCADRAAQEIAREEAKGRLLDTEDAFFLEGWVPAEDESRLAAVLSRYACAWETRDPETEEYPAVPVKLKNNWLTRSLNMVTEMYSLPAYDGVDPNPLMAPFFILFYGIMMADMGYGLLMMLASVIVLKKARPKGGMHNFFMLLGLCGASTFIMGVLTAGFFGDFPAQLVKLINPDSTFEWFWPALFTPLNNTLQILVGAMALGAVQIITGMVVSFVEKLKNGEVMDAVWEELTWWIVFAGVALAILGVTKIVLIVGGVMVVVGSGWNAKGFGKVTAIFGSLYNHVTGYFGDILSYSRLMALMLAGSVIAQVFNTLGAIPGNIIIFFIVSMAGNALNFALNLLGCYVHDLRLQCLEYFGKFYKDGGKPFRPLDINTKYVDVDTAE